MVCSKFMFNVENIATYKVQMNMTRNLIIGILVFYCKFKEGTSKTLLSNI